MRPNDDLGLTVFLRFLGSLLFIYELEVLFPEHETVAEILFPYDFVGRQFLWQALEEYFPLEEQVGAVGDGQQAIHLVLDVK